MAALKDKESYHDNTKKNMHFKQLRLNYLNNQKTKQKKEHIRLAIVPVGVDVVAETDERVL